jgi:hypothetical protein
VKVNVIDDEKLPVKVDQVADLRKCKEVAAADRAPKPSEPDWRERYLRLAAELANAKKRMTQTYARRAEEEKERLQPAVGRLPPQGIPALLIGRCSCALGPKFCAFLPLPHQPPGLHCQGQA